MFDILCVKCPNCGNELEFQSKSGYCELEVYTKSNLPPEVAWGMNGDIIKCDCGKSFKLKCNLPKKVKVKLIPTKKKAHYRG